MRVFIWIFKVPCIFYYIFCIFWRHVDLRCRIDLDGGSQHLFHGLKARSLWFLLSSMWRIRGQGTLHGGEHRGLPAWIRRFCWSPNIAIASAMIVAKNARQSVTSHVDMHFGIFGRPGRRWYYLFGSVLHDAWLSWLTQLGILPFTSFSGHGWCYSRRLWRIVCNYHIAWHGQNFRTLKFKPFLALQISSLRSEFSEFLYLFVFLFWLPFVWTLWKAGKSRLESLLSEKVAAIASTECPMQAIV